MARLEPRVGRVTKALYHLMVATDSADGQQAPKWTDLPREDKRALVDTAEALCELWDALKGDS